MNFDESIKEAHSNSQFFQKFKIIHVIRKPIIQKSITRFGEWSNYKTNASY